MQFQFEYNCHKISNRNYTPINNSIPHFTGFGNGYYSSRYCNHIGLYLPYEIPTRPNI